jgi:hypothetical protein
MVLRIVFLLLQVIVLVLSNNEDMFGPQARFPMQLSAKVTITAHEVPVESEYPPRVRSFRINYDYLSKRARADIEPGYEAKKTIIRRYDEKAEYMIRPAPIDDCKRSYLGEKMPFPSIPDATFAGEVLVGEDLCQHFIHVDMDTQIHVYFKKETGAPAMLVQEELFRDGSTVPMLTYRYTDVVLGPQDDELFELPEPYTHSSCDNQVGGFPYLHVFHYFVKF